MLKLELNEPVRTLTGADGSLLNVLGVATVDIKSTYRATKATIYILKGSTRNLLGMPELRNLNLLAIVNGIENQKFDPVAAFPNVFSGLGTMPGQFTICLKKDYEAKRLFSPRPIAIGLKDKAKKELDRMLAEDVIEPVEEPTEWCSGLTIAPKKNGKIRICIDLTSLNKWVKREVYPLPRVSDMLSKLSNGMMFSKLDANSGFWQVKMDPKSKLLTTFITPWGRFCFKRMPFGISSAPEFFQRSMEKILSGLDGVICLMDDILIYGKDSKEHWHRVHKVLQRISDTGVTLQRDKCEFAKLEIKFLGHLISGNSVKPDPDKVKAILEISPPTTKKEARRFTGMVNYLSKFSSRIAELCAPIYSVTGSRSAWYWGDVQQQAFDAVKKELASSPVLCTFDLARRHRVSADASKNALGAVLLQLNDNGDWQPIEYASRKMTEVETRYAMIEKESLAITWAIEKFEYYLLGRHFEVETDHKPLVTVLGDKDIASLPARVQRFKMRLLRFSYNIFYTPGSRMYVADSLSRPNYVSSNSEIDKLNCIDTELYVSAVCADTKHDDLLDETVFKHMMGDDVSLTCLKYIEHGWQCEPKSLTGELKQLYSVKDRLTIANGLVYYDTRVYIPKSLRQTYLERCHKGHQGVTKCRRRAQAHFWWPGLSKDIADFIAKCNTCIVHSGIKHMPMVEYDLPSRPWEVVGTDVFEFKGCLYLVLIDYYSRWIEVEQIKTQTSAAIVSAMKNVFSRFGVPAVIRSDNGGCFIGEQFRLFAKENCIKLVTSSPRYPQSNGLAESAVKIVKRLWSKCDDRAAALLAYRTAPLSTGYSPSDLMLGRSVRTDLGVNTSLFVDYKDFEDREIARMNKIKVEWDKKYRCSELPVLQPGQTVFVKAPTDVGSYGVVVRNDKSPHSYWVRLGDSEIRRNRKHLYLLHNDEPFVMHRANDNLFVIPSGNKPNLNTEAAGGEPVDYTNRELPTLDQGNTTPADDVQGAASDVAHQSRGDATASNTPQAYVTSSGRVSKPRRDPSYVYS